MKSHAAAPKSATLKTRRGSCQRLRRRDHCEGRGGSGDEDGGGGDDGDDEGLREAAAGVA
jgi:hypothetical protein